MGKAEFDYIVDKGLYDAANQLKVARNLDGQTPEGLSLPIGEPMRSLPTSPVPQEQLGAIELKAAWRVLTGKPELFGRYLTTVAWLKRPDTLECTQEVVGLVGLHIINKTQASPNFIWTTFEQVDNVPEPAQIPPQQTPRQTGLPSTTLTVATARVHTKPSPYPVQANASRQGLHRSLPTRPAGTDHPRTPRARRPASPQQRGTSQLRAAQPRQVGVPVLQAGQRTLDPRSQSAQPGTGRQRASAAVVRAVHQPGERAGGQHHHGDLRAG